MRKIDFICEFIFQRIRVLMMNNHAQLIKDLNKIQTNKLAPFTFSYLEKQLRRKSFGVVSTIAPQAKPHAVGVIYAVAPANQPFSVYLISSPTSKKVRNIRKNPNVAFAVPFPHYLVRSIPPACIQFQGKAELISSDKSDVTKIFQSSFVLRRSLRHGVEMGELVFIRLVPDDKIFCWGISVRFWQFVLSSQNKNLENLYVVVPQNRRDTEN
jgi:uncharacterized protein YhbP (UPF0306 family)